MFLIQIGFGLNFFLIRLQVRFGKGLERVVVVHVRIVILEYGLCGRERRLLLVQERLFVLSLFQVVLLFAIIFDHIETLRLFLHLFLVSFVIVLVQNGFHRRTHWSVFDGDRIFIRRQKLSLISKTLNEKYQMRKKREKENLLEEQFRPLCHTSNCSKDLWWQQLYK
jgi:hypothetical protein